MPTFLETFGYFYREIKQKHGRLPHNFKHHFSVESGSPANSVYLSVLKLVDGDEYTFSFNLAVFEKKIVEQLPDSAHLFARIGRNYIINSQYIFSIGSLRHKSSLPHGCQAAMVVA